MNKKRFIPEFTVSRRITLIYVLCGALWILLSDRILLAFVCDAELLTRISTFKGWFYVFVTALLLYWLMNRYLGEQARITADLRLSEKRFRTLLNRATDAIFVCDLDGRFLDVNREACRSLGYSREELLAMGMADVDMVLDGGGHWARLLEKLSADSTIMLESSQRRRDGSVFPVEIHIGRLEVDSRPVILGISRDISERRQAEQAIEQSRTEWAAAMDASDDAIYLLSPDRHLLRANRAFFRLTGTAPEVAMGRHIADIVHPGGERLPCSVCRAQEEKRDAVITLEADDPANPAGRPLEIVVKVVRAKDGEPLSILMILHDLTNARKDLKERERLEKQLRQAQKMEAIGTLAGGIAHDFNNILTAILGYAELAREEVDRKDALLEDIDQVKKGAFRARDLVKQILTFSRRGDSEIVRIQPHLIVNESLKLLRATIPSTIEIRHAIDKDCGAILADPSRLHQVMMNLCTNAFQAMENEPGVLTVTLQRRELSARDVESEFHAVPGPYVELAVSDTGQGMDQATMARIFEPYFTTKGYGKGTGLGLALVHGVVHECGGMIKVESEVGRGSTFRLYFPIIPEGVGQAAAAGPVASDFAGNERILVVDDEATIVAFEKFVLEGLGYTVTTTTRSTEALALFLAAPDRFDLLISDQAMPEMPGTELVKKVLAIRPELPVILCTGYSSQVNEETAPARGISKFVMKPFSGEELARVVRKALDRR
jgi:PAS domain S-box-containing protein